MCSVRHWCLLSFPTRRSSDLAGKVATTFAGQVITGASVSMMVTEKLQLAALPLASITSKLFTVVPTGKVEPLRSEEHTSELQSRFDLVCRLLLEKKNVDSVLK